MPPEAEAAEGEAIVRRAAVAAALEGHATRAPHAAWLPSLAVSGYRNNRVADEQVDFELLGRSTVRVGYVDLGRGAFRVRVEGGAGTMAGTVRRIASDAGDLVLEWPDGHRVPMRVRSAGDAWYVHALGHSTRLRERPRFLDRDADSAADGCVAPMPGKILAVRVALGQTVAAGDTLVTIEAMKMEHAVKAPHAGVVSALSVRAGDQVAGGATLVVIDAS
jgi:biotin carboxyl carrier protein